MAFNKLYKITYHFEKNGIRATDTSNADLILSATDKGSIYTVLNNNSKVPSGFNVSNLVIGSIGQISENILS